MFIISLLLPLWAQDTADTGSPPPAESEPLMARPSAAQPFGPAVFDETPLDVEILRLEPIPIGTPGRTARIQQRVRRLRRAFPVPDRPGLARRLAAQNARAVGARPEQVHLELPTHHGTRRLKLMERPPTFPGTRLFKARGRPGEEHAMVVVTDDGTITGSMLADGHLRAFEVDAAGTFRWLEEGEHEHEHPASGAEDTISAAMTSTDPAMVGGVTLSSSSFAPPFNPITPGGPNAGEPRVDLLVLYNPEEQPDPTGRIVANVEQTNEALNDSGVQGWVRLVGVEPIGLPTQPAVLYGRPATCVALEDLANDPLGVHHLHASALREVYGADLVAFLIGDPSLCDCGDDNCPCAGGCAPAPAVPDGTDWVMTLRKEAGGLSHEFGHLAGLGHWRFSTSSYPNHPPYAFGFVWPDPELASLDDLQTMCTGGPGQGTSENYRTIMAKPSEVVIEREGVEYEFDTLVRNIYSHPGQIPYDCGGGGFAPAGTALVSAVNGRAANAAWRLNETLPHLEAYRDPRVEVVGSRILTPTSGADLSGGTSLHHFTWDDRSWDDAWWLEVWVPGLPTTIFFDGPVSTTEAWVDTQGYTGVIAARLWTNVAPDKDTPVEADWVYQDFRYNTADRFLSCSSDLGIQVGDGQHNFEACETTCSVSGGTLTCDLAAGGNDDGYLLAGSFDEDNPGLYDYSFRGHDNAGVPFCCLYHDPAGTITRIEIEGSASDDDIRLVDTTDLRNSGAHLDVEVRGYRGNDHILGSNTATSAYEEYLRGYGGADVIDGQAGDDLLGGGFGADDLTGGPGADVHWAGNDTVHDVLRGEMDQEGDIVCTPETTDEAVGFITYVSEQAKAQSPFPTLAGVHCGHPAFGASFIDCEFLDVFQVPSACAAMGAPQ